MGDVLSFESPVYVQPSFVKEILILHDQRQSVLLYPLLLLITEYAAIKPVDHIEVHTTLGMIG